METNWNENRKKYRLTFIKYYWRCSINNHIFFYVFNTRYNSITSWQSQPGYYKSQKIELGKWPLKYFFAVTEKQSIEVSRND